MSFLATLKTALNDIGCDVFAPFNVMSYNKLSKRWPIDGFGIPNALSVVVGSTKNFWPHFVDYLKEVESVPKDPINAFYSQAIEAELSKIPNIPNYKVCYDWDLPKSGKFVHMQTAGHVAGVAYYDQRVGWSCHKTYGLWFVYRAVITFEFEFQGEEATVPEPTISEESCQKILYWSEVAKCEQWQEFATRLKIRDACDVGTDHRYEGDCLDYFFPINRTKGDVINAIRASS